jgi:hypothetical protein
VLADYCSESLENVQDMLALRRDLQRDLDSPTLWNAVKPLSFGGMDLQQPIELKGMDGAAECFRMNPAGLPQLERSVLLPITDRL